MQYDLVLPGLVWPASGLAGPAADLELPALAALIGHARVHWGAACTPEAWLADRVQLAGKRIPYAWLRRLGEATTSPERSAHWLCIDPVHLHFARDKLLLADASGLDITQAEADTLIAGLNETFADIGRFEAPAPDRWYLRAEREPRPFFHPLADVTGRPIQLFLPEGDDIPFWARLSNELQVWLFNHPVNAAREAAGQRAINSAWLWGAGQPLTPIAPAPSLQADDPYTCGLIRASGGAPRSSGPYAAPGTDGFTLLTALRRPLLHRDPDAWRATLGTIERDWFAPLLAALRSRHLSRLRITAPGDRACLELDVTAASLWKFWRKPLALDTLLRQTPNPASDVASTTAP